MISTILFDLDGTLLPMDQEEFTRTYLHLLCRSFAPLGYEPTLLAKTTWTGLKDMVMNKSSKTNETVFWERFSSVYGERAKADHAAFMAFYRNEFQQLAAVCHPDPAIAAAVAELKRSGYRMIVATLPAFPREAIISRLRWAGLEEKDFDYITTYENSTRCKPDPDYYKEIIRKLSLEPGKCLMVGNNTDEDMIAEAVGIRGFLMPACLINEHHQDISVYPQGDFSELLRFLQNDRQGCDNAGSLGE